MTVTAVQAPIAPPQRPPQYRAHRRINERAELRTDGPAKLRGGQRSHTRIIVLRVKRNLNRLSLWFSYQDEAEIERNDKKSGSIIANKKRQPELFTVQGLKRSRCRP